MFAISLLIFAASVCIHDALRVRNASTAAVNRKIDRILFPIAIAAGVVGLMAL